MFWMPENIRCKMSEIYKTHIPDFSMMILSTIIGKEEVGYEICKQFMQGKSVEETARLIGHPLFVVQAWYDEHQEKIGMS